MIKLQPQLLEVLNDRNDGVEGLRKTLQIAIHLELWVVPPYLYALYSIKPGQNSEIASLIRSIVAEEMLHLALDCNLLNAIGGSPKLDNPNLLPRYPHRLPGSVEHSVVVRLAPFSKDILREVFMRIEEPEIPINPFFSPEDPDPGEDHITIGDFYQGIKEHIRRLGNEIFRGDPSRQLRTGFCELQSLDIRSVDSASDAIDLIVTQGEGTKQSPFDSETELAHYYRFAEIYVGRKLVRDYDPPPGAPKFHYVGHAIPFNPSGVWPVVSDPSAFLYRRCPLLADLNRSFNGTYTRLLQTLQRVFNGEPDWLSVGFTVMGSLEKQARAMMAMEIVPGLNAGPTFEYLE